MSTRAVLSEVFIIYMHYSHKQNEILNLYYFIYYKLITDSTKRKQGDMETRREKNVMHLSRLPVFNILSISSWLSGFFFSRHSFVVVVTDVAVLVVYNEILLKVCITYLILSLGICCSFVFPPHTHTFGHYLSLFLITMH